MSINSKEDQAFFVLIHLNGRRERFFDSFQSRTSLNMKPDELTGMYTSEMLGPDGKPKMGLPKLSAAEANRQRAAAKAAKASKVLSASQSAPDFSQSVPALPQLAKPLPTPFLDSEEEYPPLPKKSRRVPSVQAPAKGDPLEIKKVTAVPAVGISRQRTKAATSQAPADQSKGTEVPPRKKET
jgi:hypothetical protein